MEGAQVIIMGLLLGVVGACPSVVLFEQALRKGSPVSVSAGLVSIMISFTTLTCAIFVVRLLARNSVLSFGTAVVVSFLVVWTIEAWRAWRIMNCPVPPRERK